MSLQNKVALVTGASRGIGRAIAIELAKSGATVIGVNRNEEHVKEFTEYFTAQGFKGQAFSMDMLKNESIENTLAEIVKIYGAPNILINNAGVTRDNLMMRMSQNEWDDVINANLNAVFRLCRLCIRDMVKARYGKIVNITSVVAHTGNPGQSNYCAAKAGLTAFSRALAIEVASRNITVNCIAPGYIETDMTRKLTDAQREAITSTIPMKRAGQPEDIANAVAFLISDKASYITGTTLHVNGGMF